MNGSACMAPSDKRSRSRLLKKPHMLRCAQSPRSNVLVKYVSARRFFARLASESFLSSLRQSVVHFCSRKFDKNCLGGTQNGGNQTATRRSQARADRYLQRMAGRAEDTGRPRL